MLLRWNRNNWIIAAAITGFMLAFYFSPTQVATRQRNSLIDFPYSDYQLASDGQYDVKASIILSDDVDGRPVKTGVACNILINIQNKGSETLRDFSWFGLLDDGVKPFTIEFPFVMYLNDPVLYGEHGFLANLLRTKHDLLPENTPLPENQTGSRHISTAFDFSYGSGVSTPAELGGLDGLIEQLQKPIRLKMLYQGGCDYLQVVPTVINNVGKPQT